MSLASHDLHHQEIERSDRWLLGAAFVVLSLFLFFYFILVPSRYTPENYATWVPSLLLFSFLDIILSLLLVLLLLKAQTHRWKVLYGILAINTFAFATLDLLEAVDYAVRFQWADNVSSDVIWSIPLWITVVGAQARYFKFPKPASAAQAAGQISEQSLSLISPIIGMSFILPVLHFAASELDNYLNPVSFSKEFPCFA